jgi:protein-S-isoprenylcysteine O-methyltransferase Ste14
MISFGCLAYVAQYALNVPWIGNYNFLFAGFFIILALLFIAPSAIAFARAQTTVNPYTPHYSKTLVTGGVYRYSRNPMYLAMAFALIAWCGYLNNLISFVCVAGFILYMNKRQIEFEEGALTVIFKQQYLSYCSEVRRWL